MTDFQDQANIINALYSSGAVDLERVNRTIGFERKPMRADSHRSTAQGATGFPIDVGYFYDDDLARHPQRRPGRKR